MSKQINGSISNQKYIHTIDVDSHEYLQKQMRPVEIWEDVRQMKERKRVNEILHCKEFRDTLEDVVVEKLKNENQVTESANPDIDKLRDLFPNSMLPLAKIKNGPIFGKVEKVVPILDSKLELPFSSNEKSMRCKLAACYRLIHIYKWNTPEHKSYITAAFGKDLLVAPVDMQFSGVSISNLVKTDGLSVSSGGDGSKNVDLNVISLHCAIKQLRPNTKSVLWLRSPSVVQLSTMEVGILPLSRDAISLGEVGHVEFSGRPIDGQSFQALEQALDNNSKILMLQNYGALIIGESIEETFLNGRRLHNAVDIQMRIMHLGVANLVSPSPNVISKLLADSVEQKRKDELEFEALLRHLENAGYNTGVGIRESLLRKNVFEREDRVNAEVELPPTVTTAAFTEEDLERARARRNVEWSEYLNSPHSYKKEEIETGGGTPYKRKITKWVSEDSPGTLIKIESPNQFVPKNTDPKELKEKVKSIRKEYYDENIHCGPQSKILEGVSWEEAQRIKDGHMASDTVIIVGAASRGIVQRGNQDVGVTMKTYYAPNPFENVTAEDVEGYADEIAKKTGRVSAAAIVKHDDSDALEPGPEGHLISTEERVKNIKIAQEEAHAISTVDIPLTPPQKPERVQVSSPTRSTSSGEHKLHTTMGNVEAQLSGTENDRSEVETPTSGKEKKKKKGFKFPSFSSKKKKVPTATLR